MDINTTVSVWSCAKIVQENRRLQLFLLAYSFEAGGWGGRPGFAQKS